jgi:hypothetical protein
MWPLTFAPFHEMKKKTKINMSPWIVCGSIAFGMILITAVIVVKLNTVAYAPVSDTEEIVEIDGYHRLSFRHLTSFPYKYPKAEDVRNGSLENQLPEAIRELNDKEIAIEGFMLPLDLDKDKVDSLLLFANRNGCCFGLFPAINGMVHVSMKEGCSTKYFRDIPVRVYGTLEVGEKIDDDGSISLYRMKANKVEVAESLTSGKKSWW